MNITDAFKITADVYQYKRTGSSTWFNCTKDSYAIFKESKEYDVRTLIILEELIR